MVYSIKTWLRQLLCRHGEKNEVGTIHELGKAQPIGQLFRCTRCSKLIYKYN